MARFAAHIVPLLDGRRHWLSITVPPLRPDSDKGIPMPTQWQHWLSGRFLSTLFASGFRPPFVRLLPWDFLTDFTRELRHPLVWHCSVLRLRTLAFSFPFDG
jgi:hypothetical protein